MVVFLFDERFQSESSTECLRIFCFIFSRLFIRKKGIHWWVRAIVYNVLKLCAADDYVFDQNQREYIHKHCNEMKIRCAIRLHSFDFGWKIEHSFYRIIIRRKRDYFLTRMK